MVNEEEMAWPGGTHTVSLQTTVVYYIAMP